MATELLKRALQHNKVNLLKLQSGVELYTLKPVYIKHCENQQGSVSLIILGVLKYGILLSNGSVIIPRWYTSLQWVSYHT